MENGKRSTSADEKWLKSFPAGYRFKPSDYELIHYYLKPKLFNKLLHPNLIKEVDLYRFTPDDLTAQHPSYGEGEWYYFTPREKKYPNGTRPNRAVAYGIGYWKATGADVKVTENGIEIGFRKTLVFHRGKPPKGDKSDWLMHEYGLKDAPQASNKGNMRLDDWVLCKIYKKRAEKYKENRIQTFPVTPITPARTPPLAASVAAPPSFHPPAVAVPPPDVVSHPFVAVAAPPSFHPPAVAVPPPDVVAHPFVAVASPPSFHPPAVAVPPPDVVAHPFVAVAAPASFHAAVHPPAAVVFPLAADAVSPPLAPTTPIGGSPPVTPAPLAAANTEFQGLSFDDYQCCFCDTQELSFDDYQCCFCDPQSFEEQLKQSVYDSMWVDSLVFDQVPDADPSQTSTPQDPSSPSTPMDNP